MSSTHIEAKEFSRRSRSGETMAWSVGAGLEGKGVIVTGAAGGIGQAVARAFDTTGARVRAVDLDQAKLDELVAGLAGRGHIGVAADLRIISSHDALIQRARRELGNVYVLANLAAVLRRRSSLDEITEDDWDFQHDVNLKSAFFLCRAAGKAMVAQGHGGRIITFASQGWWTGGVGGPGVFAPPEGGGVSVARGGARGLGPPRLPPNAGAPGEVPPPPVLDGPAPP